MPTLLQRPDVLLFTFALAVLFPIADYFFYSRLKSTMQVYLWNLLALWFLTAAAVHLIYRNGLSFADFGQNFGTYPRTLIVSAILLVLVAALVIFNKFRKSKPTPANVHQLTDNFRKLLPTQGRERLVFVFVAFTAGFCEEFLYRGWLFKLAETAFHSIWAALLISSVLFGFAHLYQGRKGVLGTTVIGLIFGLILIASRTLLPGQILHFLMDLTNGLALAKLAARSPS